MPAQASASARDRPEDEHRCHDEEPRQAEQRDRDAEHLGVGAAQHLLAADDAGRRADERRVRVVHAREVDADRDAGGAEQEAGDLGCAEPTHPRAAA